ncbi:ankyrin repeat domain-containing protein 10b [Electrophorus electricus]|uniref:Ankyrin repeat domain 10b n=1 Tax=Electrophorus electricus TaxID=8005 RepID=A0A4W4HME3_ELEEL|nr:ankyrin repeat domain-containing protein 10b [Electrophorus electricus]
MSVGTESGFSSEEVLNIRFPLHRACRDGDVGALCSLLQCTTNHADLAVEDSFYGWTPLHWAAHFGTLECVMQLIQVGCSVNSITSRFAQTPAHIAAFGGHPQCLLWLLQAGADINRQDYVGETPIHKAARAGSIECINTLLVQGAKADLKNASGLTAADLAHAQGFHQCAQLLSNTQNHQLSRLNGFVTSDSVLNGGRQLSQGRGFHNGVPSRKRSLDFIEPNHFKKARTNGLDLQIKMMNGMNGSGGEDLMETMHMELGPILSTTAPGITLSVFHQSEQPMAHVEQTQGSGNGNAALMPEAAKMDVSLVLDNLGNGLHFSHHNGFGDTAENIEDTSRPLERQKSVSAEDQYDHSPFTAMHLFHGS